MRVSPDGTFRGLRASHLCRAACRVPADPGLDRRAVALHPVIDYRPYITASPDVFPTGHPGYDQGVAADLEIPAEVQAEIEAWVGQFKVNFLHLGDRPVDQPVWRNGFDEMAWLDRGTSSQRAWPSTTRSTSCSAVRRSTWCASSPPTSWAMSAL